MQTRLNYGVEFSQPFFLNLFLFFWWLIEENEKTRRHSEVSSPLED